MERRPPAIRTEEAKKLTPVQYRFDQAVGSIEHHLLRARAIIDDALDLLKRRDVGMLKDALRQLQSDAGSALGGCVYAQALRWCEREEERRNNAKKEDTQEGVQ